MLSPVPTLLKLPKHTAEWVAKCYAFNLGLLQTETDRQVRDLGWRLHALLPRLLFGPLPKKTRPAAALMRHRCRQYLRGEWQALLRDAPAGLTLQQREALASEAEDRRGYAVDATLENSVRKMEDGRPSQSVTALLSHGLANDAFHQLLAVHFEDPSTDSLSAREQRQYDVLRHRELPQPFSDRLLTAITERVATLPRGVGAGPSGHRYEHIRAVAATSTGSAILPQLLLLLANGGWDRTMSAARLAALFKTAARDAIRPVTCGESERRVVGASMLAVEHDRVESLFLAFNQFSVSPDGCQVVYNLIRQLLAESPQFMCLAGDESSAFQLASRVEMRRQLVENFPHFVPFFSACYDTPADLIYGDQTVPAEQAGTGSQQGCPWGTFLHGLTQRRRVTQLINDNPDVWIFLLADDIFIVGPPALVVQTYEQYDAMVTASGGRMNMPKSLAWSPSPEMASHPAVVAMAGERQSDGSVRDGIDVRPATEGLRCLGHPLGSDEFARNFFLEQAAGTGRVVDAILGLVEYGNPVSIQTAYLQLRYCAEPRIAHLLRVARPDLIAEAAEVHDGHILRCLNALLGAPDDLLSLHGGADWQRVLQRNGHEAPPAEVIEYLATLATAQARLPMRRGGLGLPAAVDISPAAYLGGVVVTAQFLDRATAYNLPWTGAEYAARMDADAFPHCAQVREAWAVCAAAVEAHRRGLETDISSVLGCEDLARVHTARRQAQTLLSRELRCRRPRLRCAD